MNVKKMHRQKRALERVMRDIYRYEHNVPVNGFQRSMQDAASESWQECVRDKLAKARIHRDNLLAKAGVA